MAHPELSNGFLRIANELAEAFARTRLGSRKWQILWAIIRLTYGFSKKTEHISLGQLSKMTGIARRHISAELKKMVVMKVLVKDEAYINAYGLQKNHDAWTAVPEIGNSRNQELLGMGTPETRNESVPNSGNESVPAIGNHQIKKKKEKNLLGFSKKIEQLKLRYSSSQLIDQAISAIASTRKNGKVADSVILAQLTKWARYPSEQVEVGILIYLDKGCAAQGKGEAYLLGIIRNHKVGNQPPSKDSGTGSPLLDRYYAAVAN